jgi:hypothetical protein
MEEALHALPPMFIHDPDNFSVGETSPPEQSALAASLRRVSLVASQTGVLCAEATWVDFARIAELLTDLPAIADAQRIAARTNRSFFWNWNEEAEEMLQEREQALLHQDGGPAELSSVLQRLLELSRLLELQTLTSRLERAILPLSERAMVLAARQGKWDDVVRYRGQYLSCWNNVQARGASQQNEKRRSSTPTHLWGAFGASLATIHGHAPSPAISAPRRARIGLKRSRQRELSAFTTFPSLAALRFDISIAFRGRSPDEWDDFMEGYLKYSSCPAAVRAKLRKLKSPGAEGWTDEYHGVGDPAPQPEFAVRLCTHALQRGEVAKVDFTGRLEAVQKAENLEYRCRLAAQLIIESSGIDARVTEEANGQFYKGMQALLNASEYRAVVELSETALSQVREMISHEHRNILKGFVHLARAELERDAEGKARLLIEAGLSFMECGRQDVLKHATDMFYRAMRATCQPETYSRSAVQIVVAMFWQGVHSRQEGALRALLEFMREHIHPKSLDPHSTAIITACRHAAEAWTAESDASRIRLLESAVQAAEGREELRSLAALWLAYLNTLSPPKGVWVNPDTLIADKLAADTRRALANEEWGTLVDLARRDLKLLCETSKSKPDDLGRQVALFARSLQKAAEGDPAHGEEYAEEARRLLEVYAATFLAAPASTPEARCRWAAHASNLGFSAVWLGQFMTVDSSGVLQTAVQLLQHAVKLACATEQPVEYATYLHDLGHASVQLAGVVEPSARREVLASSCALFRESLVVYRALRAVPEYAAPMATRLEEVDYLNLARLNVLLGHEYISGFDGEFGFPVSGLCFRAAFCLLAKARDVAVAARRGPEAAVACLELADVAIKMAGACLEHTRATRGAFRRDFQHWLHAIEGHVLSTWDFAKRYATHALSSVETAIGVALAIGDESLLRRGVSMLFAVWRLAETRHGVSGAPIMFDDNRSNLNSFRQHALLTIEDLLATIQAEMGTEVDSAFVAEVKEYRSYFRGLLTLELYQEVSGQIDFISSARAEFAWLSENGNLISRGLARPWDTWLEMYSQPDGVAASGILIGRGADGLDIRVTAQRRSFCLRGVYLEDACIQLRESSWVKTHCLSAIAYLEPQVSWSDVPAITPTIVARCRTAQGVFLLLAVRLPTASWDTWVLRLRKCFDGELTLSLPFKYVGRYDRARQEFAGPASTHVEMAEDVLMFEQDHMIFEASIRFEKDSSKAPLSVRSEENGSCLQIGGEEVLFSLRTSPQVVPADTAMLVRTGESWRAACCAASFPLVAPSMTMPAAMMRAFGPLFFFDSEIPEIIREHFRQSAYHEVLLVGIPSDAGHLDVALDLLFDPRRDLFLLVEPAELEMVCEAVHRLKGRVAFALGEPLFALAASVDEDVDPFQSIQIVTVSRSLAPAASQMLLDLAARRRFPIEDVASALASVQILGDPGGMLRALTHLPSPVSWEELTSKYVDLVRAWPVEAKGSSRGDPKLDRLMQIQMQGLAERPCFLVPQGSATLLASIPFARHLGALLLPDTESGHQFCQKLMPAKIYCFEGSPLQNLPAATLLPHSPLDLAKRLSAVAREDHERRAGELLKVYPHTLASLRLSQEMAPSDYVVVASISLDEPWPSFLAANYAAALGSALLLVDDSLLFETGSRQRQSDLLTGRFWTSRSTSGEVRNFVTKESEELSVLLADSSGGFDATLRELRPKYVAFVSSRVFAPLEVVGTPPIATQYAVGRLAGPDLASTSLLITNAALYENASRDPALRAVISDAANAVAGRPLPGARQEVDSLQELFAAFNDLRVDRINGGDDLRRFLERIESANIIHFAGHGLYDDQDANQSCLVFEQGKLRATDLTTRLRGFPIVFSNACETGVASQSQSDGRGWTGLAAAFVASGAVNYIGTLWPVFDDNSCRLSGRFYSFLIEGCSAGDSLRMARAEAYKSGDPTWAAMVLFGCPRNRLRAPRSASSATSASMVGVATHPSAAAPS